MNIFHHYRVEKAVGHVVTLKHLIYCMYLSKMQLNWNANIPLLCDRRCEKRQSFVALAEALHYWFIHSILQHVLKSSSAPTFPIWLSHRRHLRNTPLICTALNVEGETGGLIYFGGPCDLCFCVWYRHQECCVVWNVGPAGWVREIFALFYCFTFFFSKCRKEILKLMCRIKNREWEI